MNTDQAPRYLSMPDPCPHITRLELIGPRLRGEDTSALEAHLAECEGAS